VSEAKDRIARITALIARVRALGKPVDDLERLLAEYREWLRLAQVHESESHRTTASRA
jgi:hypothetical protein